MNRAKGYSVTGEFLGTLESPNHDGVPLALLSSVDPREGILAIPVTPVISDTLRDIEQLRRTQGSTYIPTRYIEIGAETSPRGKTTQVLDLGDDNPMVIEQIATNSGLQAHRAFTGFLAAQRVAHRVTDGQ